MKNLKNRRSMWALLLLVAVFSYAFQAQAAQAEAEKIYHAVEMKSVLCGYSETDLSTVVKDGKEMTLEKSRIFIMLSALGMSFNTEVKSTSYMDPSTGRSNDVKVDIEQGQVKLGIKVVVEGDIAHYTPIMGGKPKDIKLTSDVILGDTQLFKQLVKDFSEGKLEKKTYKIFEAMEGEIQESTFTKAGLEKLELAGDNYDAVVIEQLNQKTGVKIKWWIDTQTSHMLKANLPNGRSLYLTDHSVVDKIKVADMA